MTYDLDRAERRYLTGGHLSRSIAGRRKPSPAESAPAAPSANPFGFFAAEALLAANPQSAATAAAATQSAGPPKTVIVLFDISLSMQWEKLERSYQALETLLRGLQPADKFNLILFNSQTQPFQPAPIAADAGAIQRALDFVKASRLRGGTNLQLALDGGLQQWHRRGQRQSLYRPSQRWRHATRGPIKTASWLPFMKGAGTACPLPCAPKPTYIFGVGDDANMPLLTMLSRQDGVMENVLSTEPIDFKLAAFLSKIGRSPVGQLRLDVSPAATVDAVYPLQESAFSGGLAAWVGRYQTPQAAGVMFTARGVRDGNPLAISSKAALPAQSLDHPQLPRLWARALR